MKRILCYGDSNTHGCNPQWTAEWDADPSKHVRFSEDIRWTGVLQKLLGEEYTIIEEGLPGRSTVFVDPLKPYLDGRSTITPIALSHSPFDLLVIMLGTNDLKTFFTPSEMMLGGAMEELIKVVKNPYIWEHGQVPPILLVSPPEIVEEIENSPFYGMYDRKSVALSKKMGAVYERVSKKYDSYFLDAAQYVQASPLDCIHMDPENHEKLAKALCDKIKGIMNDK